MGTAISVVVIAVGAILRYAVTASTEGINLHTTGMIWMVVGTIGLFASLLFWNSWGGVHRRTVIDSDRGRIVNDEIL